MQYRDRCIAGMHFDAALTKGLPLFLREHGLSEEFEKGLMMLTPAGLRKLLQDKGVLAKLRQTPPRGKQEALLNELHKRAPAATVALKLLLRPVSNSGQGSSSSSAATAHAAAPTPSSGAAAPGRPGCEKSRSRKRRRLSRRDRQRRKEEEDEPQQPASVLKGVWQDEDEEEDEQPAGRGGGEEAQLVAWLRSLDGGKGGLEKYLGPLQREFGSLTSLPACVLPGTTGGSVVSRIDRSFWEALGVQSLGHRLLLAKGILALEED